MTGGFGDRELGREAGRKGRSGQAAKAGVLGTFGAPEGPTRPDPGGRIHLNDGRAVPTDREEPIPKRDEDGG